MFQLVADFVPLGSIVLANQVFALHVLCFQRVVKLHTRFGAVEVHEHREPFGVFHHHLAEAFHSVARCEVLQMQYVVGNVAVVNRLTHWVVEVQIVVFVKRGREQ